MTIDKRKLDMAFNPRTVAVVGAKKSSDYNWLRNMQTFQGKLYSVQIDPDEIPGIEELGIPNYESVSAIPDEVDYVTVAVPRRAAPIVLKDCIAKGVKTVHFFTSGFAESGTEDGIQLQETIVQMARDADLLLIGPNCMGVFNPAVGMRFSQSQQVGEPGEVTFLAQSGGHAGSLTEAAQARGMTINKTISFGNAVILDGADLLEYFAEDERTQVITMYVEGSRDARRFFQALKSATRRKPVVIWKGGQTEDGKRATSSHTGALAGSMEVWDGVLRQSGAVRADSLDEAIDMTRALLYLTPPTGTAVGIIGGSGGQSVTMSDAFAKQGLQVPLLSPDSLERLGSFFQLVGASYFNPIDVGGLNRPMIETIMGTLSNDPKVHNVVIQMGVGLLQDDNRAQLEMYGRFQKETGKPFLAVLHSPNMYRDGPALDELDKKLREMRIPSFPSPDRAARALRKVVDHYRFRASVLADGPLSGTR